MESVPIPKNEIAAIRNGNPDTIKELYKSSYPYCTAFIIKNGGDQEDAREIFQKSMVILLEKLNDEAFELTSTIKKYLSGICRNQWLKELKRRGKMKLLDTDNDIPDASVFEPGVFQEDESSTRIQQVFQHLNSGNETCKRLLVLTFFNKLSDKEIAPVMNYSLEFVRNKRRRCIASIRKRINKAHG